MQVDDSVGQHDDFDSDSLFGSPPPSPSRGRSPSPLALPGGQNSTQNVGTLALPGSHLCSELYELPSAPPPPPSVPAKRSVTQRSQLQVTPSRSNSGTPAPANLGPRPVMSSRKPKRASRRATPDVRPTPPPITLPSPTDPPPANFLRNQQALLGLAGLVGGVNPANLSVQRHTRGESASNPIVVEDVPDTPKIGRRPVNDPYLSGPMPTPSAQEVVSTLVRQKNLYPLVNALVRLVNNAAGVPVPVPYTQPVPASTPTAGPSQHASYLPAYYSYSPYQYSYPYTYPYSYPYATSYPHTSYHQYAVPLQPPPMKKRKLTNVPAGAADWDVPYPFPAGQGPRDYHSTWARHRQQQLLDDLVGLVKSASQKAAAKKAKDEAGSEAAIGSVEYYKERFLRHCRPPSPEPSQRVEAEPEQAVLVDNTPPATPKIGTLRPAFPQVATDAPAVEQGSVALVPNVVHGTEDEGGSLPVSQDLGTDSTQNDIVAETAGPETPPTTGADFLPSMFPPISPEGQNTSTNIPGSSDLDELLALLNDIPAGDLDAIFASSSDPQPGESSSSSSFFPDLLPASSSSELPALDNSQLPALDPSLFAMDPSLLAIDPALLAISFPPARNQPGTTSMESEVAGSSNDPFPAFSMPPAASTASSTPPLAGSPMSFADQDPQTPNWDFNFAEPEIATADGESTNGGGTIQTDHTNLGGGDDGVRRRDKGKQRATEADFVDVQRDRSMSMSGSTGGYATPGLASGRGSATPVPPARASEIVTPRTHSMNTSTVPSSHWPLPLSLPSYAPTPVPAKTPFLARSTVVNKRAASLLQRKNKEDIIRRAKLMRAQILEEIERAKVELWETTMEGGCLAMLAKERDKIGAKEGSNDA